MPQLRWKAIESPKCQQEIDDDIKKLKSVKSIAWLLQLQAEYV